MNQYTFTYIIGYRHTPDRLQNLRRTLDWINGFGGVEVLLVEQDKHSKISHLNLKAKHIFLKSSLPYNRSWSFNVAVKNAKSNIVVFGDSDLIMDPNRFIEALKELDNYEMISPYTSVVDLNQNESNMQLNDMLLVDRPGRGELDNQKINPCGGICIFRKEAIDKIGGWDERFLGWGAEDDFLTIKVNHFLSFKEMPNRCYHLFHNRSQTDMKFYQRNLELLQKSKGMSKEELIKTINSQVQKNGMKNKYESY